MSAMKHLPNVSIPLAMVAALDDPLVCEKTMGDPWTTVNSNEAGNVFLLLTQKGGHVGYPVGNIRDTKWQWMSNVVHGFVDAVVEAKKEEEKL